MKQRYLFAAILLLGMAYALLTGVLFHLADLPFDSDEAIHALDGLQLAADLQHGHFAALLNHIYFTQWYPPLLPAYLAPFFIALKPAYWSARYPIVLLTLLCLSLMYRVACITARSPRAGLITLAIAATSPVLWLQSLVCMEEMLAIAGMLTTFLLYLRARRIHPAWIGVSLAFTLLAKLPIGLYTAAAVGLTLWLSADPLRDKLRFSLRAFTPLLIIGGLWWAHPAKIQDFLHYVEASPPAYTVIGWNEFIRYAKALATTCTINPAIGVLTLAAMFATPMQWKNPGWRLSLLLVMVTWAAMLIKRQWVLRFFIGAVPASFILAGAAWATYGNLPYRYPRMRRWAYAYSALWMLVALSAFAYIGARAASFPLLAEIIYETDRAATTAYTQIDQALPPDTHILLVNGWDPLSAQALSFERAIRRWPAWETDTVNDIFLVDPAQRPQGVEQFQATLEAYPTGHVVHLSNTPVPSAGAWWAYEARLKFFWDGEWQALPDVWVRVWDGNVAGEMMRAPFRYITPDVQAHVRKKYGYPLLIKIQVAAFSS